MGATVVPLPRTRRQQSRLDAILEGASTLFNEEGIGAVSLMDVARRVDVSRATLYHHVNDREDLVFRCYQRSCETTVELLEAAAEIDDPLAGILHYLRESLANPGASAVVTDLGWMSADGRSIIAKAVARNHLARIELIERGIEAGRIRPCDARIVSHGLASLIAHFQMAARWVDISAGPLDVDAVVDCVRIGAVVDRSRPFAYREDVDRFSRLRAAGFGPGGMAEMRIEQILMAASRLFNARGVEGVSIDEIASELGATRGVVYHYFSDKEDLVRRCADRAHALFEAFIDHADRTGRDSVEKLSIVGHLNSQALAGTLQPLVMWIGLDAFAAEGRRQHRERLRQLLARAVAFVEGGIAAGERHPFDPRTLVVVGAGAFSWIPRWHPAVPDATPHAIADELTALVNHGLASDRAR